MKEGGEDSRFVSSLIGHGNVEIAACRKRSKFWHEKKNGVNLVRDTVEHREFCPPEDCARAKGKDSTRSDSRPLANSACLMSNPLPTLPLEIWSHIIRLSLPVKCFASFRERYDVLLAYSLVNRIWRELAQAQLLRHVWLEDKERAERFLAGVDRTGPRRQEHLLRRK